MKPGAAGTRDDALACSKRFVDPIAVFCLQRMLCIRENASGCLVLTRCGMGDKFDKITR